MKGRVVGHWSDRDHHLEGSFLPWIARLVAAILSRLPSSRSTAAGYSSVLVRYALACAGVVDSSVVHGRSLGDAPKVPGSIPVDNDAYCADRLPYLTAALEPAFKIDCPDFTGIHRVVECPGESPVQGDNGLSPRWVVTVDFGGPQDGGVKVTVCTAPPRANEPKVCNMS